MLQAQKANDQVFVLAAKWTEARQAAINVQADALSSKYLSVSLRDVDELVKTELAAKFRAPAGQAALMQAFQPYKTIPGKLTAGLDLITDAIREIKDWNKYVADSEVALLGADAVLRVVNIRTLTVQAARAQRACLLYVQDSPELRLAEIQDEAQKWVVGSVELIRELAEAKPVIDEIRRKNLFQLMITLLSPELDMASRALKAGTPPTPAAAAQAAKGESKPK